MNGVRVKVREAVRVVGAWVSGLVVIPLLLLLPVEGMLRLFWTNPYQLRADHPEYTRLHPAGLVVHGRADELYAGGGRVRLAVDERQAILAPAAARPNCIALGGSTTESALVPEGRRWPELLQPPAANYGVSENTLIDSYHNLRALLALYPLERPCVLVMHAVNDLRAFLQHGPERFSVQAWRLPPIQLLASEAELPLGPLRAKQSALASFLLYQLGEWRGRSWYPVYLGQRRAQEGLPPLDGAQFESTMARLHTGFLPRRAAVLRELAALVDGRGGQLYLLTQPHAFRPDYRPHAADIRLYPVVDGMRADDSQAARMMAAINEQTRAMARELGVVLVDVDACIARQASSPLFYDSVHYTAEGSGAVAGCVREGIAAGGA